MATGISFDRVTSRVCRLPRRRCSNRVGLGSTACDRLLLAPVLFLPHESAHRHAISSQRSAMQASGPDSGVQGAVWSSPLEAIAGRGAASQRSTSLPDKYPACLHRATPHHRQIDAFSPTRLYPPLNPTSLCSSSSHIHTAKHYPQGPRNHGHRSAALQVQPLHVSNCNAGSMPKY